MSDEVNDLDAHLARLAGATEALGVRGGFTDRVMAALSEPEGLFVRAMLRFGRHAVLLALVAAVVGGWAALRAERATEEVIAATYGMEEVVW